MKSHLDFSMLNEYLDEELNKDEIERVRAHLEVCSQCQQELAEVARLRQSLTIELGQILEEMGAETDWHNRVLQAYRGNKPANSGFRWGFLTRSAYRPAIALGAAALLLLALYLPLEKRVPSQEPARMPFQAEQELPSPDKEMRLFGLDQRGGPEVDSSQIDRVRVYSSDDETEVVRVFEALQKANLEPVRRGDEILVERINQAEAEKIITAATKK